MAIVSLNLFGAILGRLAYLQLAMGEKNRLRAEENRVRVVPKPPLRGDIFDRNGKLLATNRLTHSIFVWPSALKRPEWPQIRTKLSVLLGMSAAEIETAIEEAKKGGVRLLRLKRNLTPAQIVALEESQLDKFGVQIDTEAVRYYPYGEVAAHILGYTGELSVEEYNARRKDGYRLGDIIGKGGVEAAYESLLRGEWGGQQIEVDGAGRVQNYLGPKPAKPGQSIYLALDLDLQLAAEKAIGNRKAAIVALDPHTGAILAMASKPSFDPNWFSEKISPANWQKINSPDRPLLNRALQVFPPASTFKIVTVTAALESGKYTPETRLQTYASLTIGGTRFADWNHAGFGVLNFQGALQWSSDTFFYQIAQGIGEEALIDWTRRYGFGRRTGIELPEEKRGLVADDSWKQKNLKSKWSIGDTVNMSIGQGFLQASPLQVSTMFAVPANGGYLVRPHLLRDTNQFQRQSLNINPKTLEVIRQGLRQVVDSGTGKALNSPTIPPAAGKSGTAEAPPGPSHVWFGGYAPLDRPEIVVVAFGEHLGGGGGKIAAPMVLQVMETYFNRGKPLPINSRSPVSLPDRSD